MTPSRFDAAAAAGCYRGKIVTLFPVEVEELVRAVASCLAAPRPSAPADAP